MREKVLVLFGGKSSEHEVSNRSVITILENIDNDIYEPIIAGITKDGEWKLVDSIDQIKDGTWYKNKTSIYLLPDSKLKSALIKYEDRYDTVKIDVIFPVLHGLNGEDGSIQGLFHLADIPYVGCGILASAVGMDKIYTKRIVDDLDINQAEYIFISALSEEDYDIDEIDRKICQRFGYPVFVKPSNAGSSQGVSKASDKRELSTALKNALKHDRKILIEESISGRELECAVYGYGFKNINEIIASPIGEIVTTAAFYDYDSKYLDSTSKQIIDPSDIPNGVKEIIKKYAKDIFNAIDGFGLSRVDFFYSEEKGVVFNEINTLPGFTSISMYPMLMDKYGMDNKELINGLIKMSKERMR